MYRWYVPRIYCYQLKKNCIDMGPKGKCQGQPCMVNPTDVYTACMKGEFPPYTARPPYYKSECPAMQTCAEQCEKDGYHWVRRMPMFWMALQEGCYKADNVPPSASFRSGSGELSGPHQVS